MNTRALLASPLGFLIGIALGAFGGGGSILAVPALVYVAGQDPKAATNTSLFIVGAAALTGMVAHWRAGRVRVVPGIMFGLAGVGGSLLGSRLNSSVDPDVLLLLFAGLMGLAAWRMCVRECRVAVAVETHPGDPDACADVGGIPSRIDAATTAAAGATATTSTLVQPRTHLELTPAMVAKVLVAGTVVGFITGFFGVGGGFVVVPALVLALGFTMPEAVGTSLLVISINSAVALASRVGTTTVDWGVTIPFTITALLGSLVGKRIADKLPSRALAQWFVGLLVVLAAYTGIRSALALGA